jgi:hypothetical protein
VKTKNQKVEIASEPGDVVHRARQKVATNTKRSLRAGLGVKPESVYRFGSPPDCVKDFASVSLFRNVSLRRIANAAQPRKGTLGRLVDQSDRPAVDVLELHVEGVRMVPEAQHLCVPKIRFCNIGDEGRQG